MLHSGPRTDSLSEVCSGIRLGRIHEKRRRVSMDRTRWVSIWIVVGLALGVFATSAPFVTAAEQDEPVESLPGVTVSAERIYPVPGAATTRLTDEDVEEALGKDVGDVLKGPAAPGVTGLRRGGINLDPVIRGLREDRINVMINGMKQWGAGPFRMDPPTSLIDATSLGSIEVIRGPYTVTRGPSTLAGAINLVTKEPEFHETWALRPSLASQFSAGNWLGWTVRPILAGGNDRVAFRVQGGFRDYGDYESGNGTTIQSQFTNRSVVSDVLVKTAPNQRLRLSFSIDSDRDAFFQGLPLTAEIDDAYMGSATYQFLELSPLIERLELTAYYTHIHHVMSNAGKPTLSSFVTEFPLDSATVGGRLQANLRLFGGLLSVGGDYYRLLRTGTLTNRHPTTGAVMQVFNAWPSGLIQDGGVFAELQRALNPRWRLVVGARVDFVNADAKPDSATTTLWQAVNGNADPSQTETNVSANARLIYSPVPTLDLFVGVGRAVRTADTVERFFRGPSPGVANAGPGIIFTVGNPGLDPEQSLEVDAGMKGSLGALTFEGSFFWSHIDDFILRTLGTSPAGVMPPAPGSTIRVHRNINNAQLLGGDFLFSYQLTPHLALIGSFQYVRGENENQSKPLPEIPPLDTTWGFRYERVAEHFGSRPRLWLQPMIRGVQAQKRIDPAAGEVATAGFVTVNLSTGIEWPSGYRLALNVDNLLDLNYREHLTPFTPNFSGTASLASRQVFEPGRVIIIGVQGPIPGWD
ncbi:MAG: TonB-dependent receptor [Nitrospirae bacterium]|nr:MAG: TonB-dependent receptor [Nitrospirota bacterium]